MGIAILCGEFRTKNRGLETCPQQAKTSGGSSDALLASMVLKILYAPEELNIFCK